MLIFQKLSIPRAEWEYTSLNREQIYVSKKYKIKNILDRAIGGASFGDSLIYGPFNYDNQKDALEFAVAAAVLSTQFQATIIVLLPTKLKA